MAFGFSTTGDEVVEAFKDEVLGKTFLITGPSEHGIGAETALSLAKASPAHLILAGRSRTKIDPVISQISQISPSTKTTFLSLDLANHDSIQASVPTLKVLLNTTKIDALINNAAIMACPFELLPTPTSLQIESQFLTNHLGPFLFTTLLLNNHLLSPTARIVNVNSSASNRLPSTILPHLSSLPNLTYQSGKAYNPWTAYTVSKAATLLTTRRLASLLASSSNPDLNRINTFSPHPGSIRSPLQRHLNPELVKDAIRLATESDPDFTFPEQKTLQQGCATQLRAVLDPSLKSFSGAYMEDCQIVEHAHHKRLVEVDGLEERVWKVSEELVGVSLEL